jgi:glycosyltransferase involved in cell wall biosynthesis
MMHYIKKGRTNYLRRLEGLDAFVLRPGKLPEPPRRSFFQIGPRFFRRWTNRHLALTRTARQPLGNPAPLISIVVTVKNDIPGFLATHRSICRQSFTNFEYIVVDRCSTDGTRERVRRHNASIDLLIEEAEKSRSDAMKMAAGRAKGRYLLILNAGNEFVGSTSLEEAVQDAHPEADIIYGHHYGNRSDGSVKLSLAADLNKIRNPLQSGATTDDRAFRFPCQQAVLLSREFILDNGLLLGSRASEHHKLLREACRLAARTYHSNTVIVRC